jgi:hypothetical protein
MTCVSFYFMRFSTVITPIRKFPWEAAIWLCGLCALAWSDPGDRHFSICPLAMAGLEWCPGCGLGTSISYLFRGEVKQSLATHPLGFFALIVLSYRILTLTKNYIKFHGTRH